MLSESELQSQLAMNSSEIRILHELVVCEQGYIKFEHERANRYKLSGRDKIASDVISGILEHSKTIQHYKKRIAKYAKLQKALKDSLQEIRWSKRKSKRVIEVLEHIGMWESGIHFDDEELPGMWSNSDLIGGAEYSK